MKTRLHAAMLAVVITVGLVCASIAPARASSESTWRGLTYGLGGLTAYGAVRRSPTIALLGAAGTAYSYSRWRQAERDRHRRQHYYRRRRYYRHYYRHYR